MEAFQGINELNLASHLDFIESQIEIKNLQIETLISQNEKLREEQQSLDAERNVLQLRNQELKRVIWGHKNAAAAKDRELKAMNSELRNLQDSARLTIVQNKFYEGQLNVMSEIISKEQVISNDLSLQIQGFEKKSMEVDLRREVSEKITGDETTDKIIKSLISQLSETTMRFKISNHAACHLREEIDLFKEKSDANEFRIRQVTSCPICYFSFSSRMKKPVVGACGHTACNECAAKSSICAICRAPSRRNVINYILM